MCSQDYVLYFCNAGGNDDDEQNPVRKALRRAEARPKNLAKSMEDITTSAAPREHVLHPRTFSCFAYVTIVEITVCFSLFLQDKKEEQTQLQTSGTAVKVNIPYS